jgi:gluconokinase
MPAEDDQRPGPTTVVVMGVSGSGKSAVAGALSELLHWPWLDADDLHPAANVAAMAAGHPLGDAERAPWLRAVAGWIGEQEQAGHDAVLACSALRRRYRDVLRDGHPSVLFAHLEVDPALVARRLQARQGHFMPARLLGSQLAAMEELAADEPGIRLVVAPGWTPAQTAGRIIALVELKPLATP